MLVPAYTFPATANAVVRAGHVPVLSDICPQRWTLTPAIARDALARERFDAVLPVAVFGVAILVEAWDAFNAQTGVPVIVDAAAALGAMEGARRVVVAYSLPATKPLGIGEGDVIATTDAAFAARVRKMINHGFEAGEVTTAGTNARLCEYASAIGLAQLARWPRILARRRVIWNRYRERLAGVAAVRCRKAPTITRRGAHGNDGRRRDGRCKCARRGVDRNASLVRAAAPRAPRVRERSARAARGRSRQHRPRCHARDRPALPYASSARRHRPRGANACPMPDCGARHCERLATAAAAKTTLSAVDRAS